MQDTQTKKNAVTYYGLSKSGVAPVLLLHFLHISYFPLTVLFRRIVELLRFHSVLWGLEFEQDYWLCLGCLGRLFDIGILRSDGRGCGFEIPLGCKSGSKGSGIEESGGRARLYNKIAGLSAALSDRLRLRCFLRVWVGRFNCFLRLFVRQLRPHNYYFWAEGKANFLCRVLLCRGFILCMLHDYAFSIPLFRV